MTSTSTKDIQLHFRYTLCTQAKNIFRIFLIILCMGLLQKLLIKKINTFSQSAYSTGSHQ